MSAQHTLGPWRLGKDAMGKLHTVWGAQVGVAVTSVFDSVFGPDCPPQAEATANARLIAAAPDGLKAAQDALAGWRYIRAHHGEIYGVGWDRVEEKLAAFIAKATT